MRFAVFPPIGIARLGNSDEFFVGPEWPGGAGVDIAADGTERDVASFKDTGFRVKRQAARFRLFEVADDGTPGQPLQLPPGARVRWTVHLVNKKAAIRRPPRPPDLDSIALPVETPRRDKLLDGGVQTVSGASAGPVTFTPNPATTEPHPTYLGELRTDRQQRLLVLGGRGDSFGDSDQLLDWYTNEAWYDDVSDGPVTAEIALADGTTTAAAAPAWVIVAPPDFAPTIGGIVTLYDLLFQVGHEHFGRALPDNPSFTKDVYPLIKRASELQWVHANTKWSTISTDFAALSQASCASPVPPLLTKTVQILHEIQHNTNLLDKFALLGFQNELIGSWASGRVACDWQGVPAVDRTITPDGLTRAALEAGVGAGLHPGIEAGVIVTRPDIYSSPFAFRFSPAVLKAGDVTAFMALPWQADFYDCRGRWWPAQRPDIVRASAAPSDRKPWAEGVNSYLDMVNDATKLGVLRPRTNAQGEVVGMIEEGRDHSLPHAGP